MEVQLLKAVLLLDEIRMSRACSFASRPYDYQHYSLSARHITYILASREFFFFNSVNILIEAIPSSVKLAELSLCRSSSVDGCRVMLSKSCLARSQRAD